MRAWMPVLCAVLCWSWRCDAAISVVAAETVYGSVARIVGGDAVTVVSILDRPAVDPHEFEARPDVARAVAAARLIIWNGAGYDPWMGGLLSADSGMPGRQIIEVARLVHAPPGANPHLWATPAVMRMVTEAIAQALIRLDPGDQARLNAGRERMRLQLDALDKRIAAMRAQFAGVAVAETEPVFGPMAHLLGLRVLDERFGLAVMNGTEPRASDVAAIEDDISSRRIKVLLVNAQVSDSSVTRLAGLARSAGVAVVSVSETLPPGQDYAAWMTGMLSALERALAA